MEEQNDKSANPLLLPDDLSEGVGRRKSARNHKRMNYRQLDGWEAPLNDSKETGPNVRPTDPEGV